ncbi:MAG: hypothetical protein EP330_26450 [Deltaproteobacteria bacterium]|nr:MAG: hypothetical protein EP330_26450 [Deltaproteobacteria bacterium]
MPRTLFVLSLCLPTTALAQDGVAEEELPQERAELDAGADLYQGVGFLYGDGLTPGSGVISLTEIEARGELDAGEWRLSVPVDLSHRQTWGFALAELRARGGVELSRGFGETRVGVEAMPYLTWRPGWPDVYQPQADGTLLPTNRRSNYGLDLGGSIDSRIGDRIRTSFGYTFTTANYVDDPNYDPTQFPTHVVPGDHVQHEAHAQLRHDGERTRVDAGVKFNHRSYANMYARDAGTGLTHATPGGTAANPLFVRWQLDPWVQTRFSPGDGPVELRIGYELETQTDVYQGYYSYIGQRPSLGADVDLDRVRLRWRGDMAVRRYGPNSYAEGGNHLPLNYGKRRIDLRYHTSIGVDWVLSDALTAELDGDVLIRRTNFPNSDGINGLAPDGYDLPFSYDNALATVGLRYAF